MAALFFSQRKPRGFNYRPRYYDPDAEERENRKKIVLGDRYRTPAQRKADAARAAGEDAPDNYVPGAYLREHISARRGAHASDVMRKRRRKTQSIPVRIVILAAIVFFIWMFYFK
ncbi:MAG: hypothetical protein LBU98_05170 [Alistipes sp.]|jgi:hypothetical protein|nr:hypothetical protein [Alistipes sp.]